MVTYIEEHRKEFGVEPICRVLQVAPSTYYAARSRLPSARQLRDAVLMPILLAIWTANFEVYGVRKMWKAMVRAGHDIGRDQTARLMAQLGIRGVRKGKKPKTTKSDPAASRPPDLVDRQFEASGPNQLWVTDLTYVATRAGMAYTCFITDVYSRMIVGWRVATHMHTDMVLDALEMARWSPGYPPRGPRRTPTLPSARRCCDDSLNPVSSHRSVTGNDSPSSERSRRSDRWVTASIMQWPSHSSASTRTNWSATGDPGAMLTNWN